MKSFQELSEGYRGQPALQKYRMPSDDIDPEKKAKDEYCRKVLEYLFCQYINGHLYTGHSREFKYREIRNYATGDIPIEKYKEYLLGKDSQGHQRKKSYINISWRPDTGHLKTLDQIKGAYDKKSYDVFVKAIDPSSMLRREREVAALKLSMNDDYRDLIESTGVAMDKPNVEFNDAQEVDLYVKLGGIKLQEEISMKKAINVTKKESGWDVLRGMLMEDLVNIGICATKDYINQLTKVPCIRYVDPEHLLIPCSSYKDFRDANLAAEIRKMTIADLRAEANEDDLPEWKLMDIAKKYGYGAGIYDTTAHQAYYDTNGYYPYDHMVVYVIDGSWKSSDIEKYTKKHIEKYGTLEYKRRPFDYKLPEKEAKAGKTIDIKRIQYTYEGCWIIGTPYCFNYGKSYNQVGREKNGYYQTILPYHIHTTGAMPKTARIIADVDEINILTFKRRNAIAAIPAPPGLIINKSALENVQFDGSIKSPIDLMNMFLEKGVLAVETEDANGNPITNIHSIVTPVATAMYEQFRIYSELIQEKRVNIQISTGMNDMVDGSTTAERQLKGQIDSKLEAANNALQPEYSGMRALLEDTFQAILLRWQQVVKEKNFKMEYSPLSHQDIEMIEITADISKLQFGLFVEIASTEQQRQELLAQIANYKMARQQNGAGGITEDVYLMLYRVIMTGDLALAQFLLAKSIQRQRMVDEEMAMTRQEQNGQIQTQSAIAVETEKRKTMFAESAAEMIINQHKMTCDATLEVVKADLAADSKLDDVVLKKQIEMLAQGASPDFGRLQSIIMGGGEQAQQQQ